LEHVQSRAAVGFSVAQECERGSQLARVQRQCHDAWPARTHTHGTAHVSVWVISFAVGKAFDGPHMLGVTAL
jgi:hypothetical protein